MSTAHPGENAGAMFGLLRIKDRTQHEDQER